MTMPHDRTARRAGPRFPSPAAGSRTTVLLACLAALAVPAPALAQAAGASPAAPPPAATAATAPEARKPAEPSVRAAHARLKSTLPFDDRADFDDADRGFVATLPDAQVAGPQQEAWSMRDYAFLNAPDAPDTVNPSLWRQARLNLRHGLYKVVDRVYQVRGFDISNMTIVEGDTGLILIDPLTTTEVARAALDLYLAHRPARPVVAVVYTHSHADHFGGVKGVTSAADVSAGRVRVIAPLGFMEHAVSENVIAGTAMSRRAGYQFGVLLDKGERAQVDAGLGKTVARGTISLIAPTDVITKPYDERVVDGVMIRFQLAPSSEAPAEMHLHFPQLRVLDMAENVTHNFHNLLPLRGAEVRDALAWSRYIDEALRLFGAQTEVLIAQHHWPTFGRERATALLARHRDLYKYVHDQTLRLINQGYTGPEIAEVLELPPGLARDWSLRDYYGTIRHNVKAIYQRYLGWYDGNPAHLDALPPVAQARHYVEYMGGAAEVTRRARDDFRRGEYRWVAQVMNHVVFADPGNREARALAADALEQMGYMTESATWRNAYLVGAWELRAGVPASAGASTLGPDLLQALPLDKWFDLMGVRLNAARAAGRRLVIDWVFPDVGQRYALNLENSALTVRSNAHAPNAQLTVTLDRATLDRITLARTTFPQAVQEGKVRLAGDASRLAELLSLLDPFVPRFEIVEPKRTPDGLPPR